MKAPVQTIQAFWPTGPKPGNMGDLLTPLLVKWMAGVTPTWTPATAVGTHLVVGSVIKFAARHARVWGTGAMWYGDKPSPDASYFAVRGPLTRQVVLAAGGSCPEIYGDPALLLPLFHNAPVTKQYRLGIVPHYVDYNAAKLAWNLLPNTFVINILRSDPLQVIDEIRRCEYIVSSSLHGLIVAQAYGIPAVAIGTLAGKLSGDGIKFRDYLLSTGQPVVDPVKVSGQETESDLISMTREAALEIDLDLLLDACPVRGASATMNPQHAPTVVSFYTPDYAQHAANLQADCQRLNLPCHIVPLPSTGSWIDNTRLKGPLVAQVLAETGRPVVWIDADASLLQWPHLLYRCRYDFAAFAKDAGSPRPWSVGTLYFNATSAGMNLANRWAHWCKELPAGTSDEAALALAWEEVGESLTVRKLPRSYFSLKPQMGDVIVHRLSGNASVYNRLQAKRATA